MTIQEAKARLKSSNKDGKMVALVKNRADGHIFNLCAREFGGVWGWNGAEIGKPFPVRKKLYMLPPLQLSSFLEELSFCENP